MKNKICPNDGSSIKWDGFGWTCPKCGFQFEPNGAELEQAMKEIASGEANKWRT